MPRSTTWSALALAAAMLPAGVDARPKFEAVLESPKVAIDARAVVTITASWEERGGKGYRILTPQAPEPKKLALARPSSDATSVPTREGAKHRVRFVCAFVPQEEGEAETGPIEMRYLSTDISQIASGGDSAAQYATHEIKSLKVEVTGRSLAWLWQTLLAVAVVAIVGAVLLVTSIARDAKQKSAPAMGVGDQETSLESEFLPRLATLRTLRIEGDTKAYVGRIAELLTEYVQTKFGADPMDPSGLAEHLDEKKAQRLSEIVAIAEDIRYAGKPPVPAELDRIASFAESLIREQLPKTDADPLSDIRLK